MVTFQNVTPVYLIYFIVNKNSSFPISGYKKTSNSFSSTSGCPTWRHIGIIKCLLCKPENLTLFPQHSCKRQRWFHDLVIKDLKRWRQTDLGGFLASQPNCDES